MLKGERAFIQIDIDAAQLGKNYPIDLGLVGPADVILERMNRGKTPRPRRPGKAIDSWPLSRNEPCRSPKARAGGRSRGRRREGLTVLAG